MLYTGIVKGAPKWRPIAVVAALFLIFTGLNIFGEYRSSDPHYQHIIFGALALLSQRHFCLHFDQMEPSLRFARRALRVPPGRSTVARNGFHRRQVGTAKVPTFCALSAEPTRTRR